MKLDKETLLAFKHYKNSLYDDIKVEFLYYSNKIEGSTFTIDALYSLLDKRVIIGNHSVDDVFETINSLKLYDLLIQELYQPISDTLLFNYHRLLKQNTRDEELGFSGRYKTLMNRISGSSIQVAYPQEVENAIHNLIQYWESIDTPTIEDIALFHSRFEHIHPFQDGNGRIGRFLILKQCLENDIDLIAIDDDFSAVYKIALEQAQTTGDIESLVRVFEHCQERLDKKMAIYKDSVEKIQNELHGKTNKIRTGHKKSL